MAGNTPSQKCQIVLIFCQIVLATKGILRIIYATAQNPHCAKPLLFIRPSSTLHSKGSNP